MRCREIEARERAYHCQLLFRGLDREHGWQTIGDHTPALAAVGGAEDLARPAAEVEAERIATVLAKSLTQDREIGILLWQTSAQGLPGRASVAGLEDPDLALGGYPVLR